MTRVIPFFVLSALALGACADLPLFVELTSTDGTAPTNLTASGEPLSFPRLTESGGALFADLAVDAKGTLHALSTEADAAAGRQVYHRASSDGGKTWSEPEALTEANAEAGVCRLALDGKGRLYAIWKDDTEADLPSGALYRGTLRYRVLDAGAWSPAVRIGTEAQAMSWYPAVTPGGLLYLVWNETVPFGKGYTSPAEAGVIKKAPLDGVKVGRVDDIYRPNAVPVAGTSAYHFDSFEGLNGFIDAGAVPQYVAQKARAAITEGVASEPQDIILRLAGFEQTFLKVDQFLKGTTHFIDPPALVRDAGNRTHLVLLDSQSDRAGLVDYLTSDKFSFTTVYRLKEKNGRFMGAQVRQGPQGQWVALMELQDTADQTAPIDLYVARYDGTKWQTPVNLTLNAAREAPLTAASPAPTPMGRVNVKFASAAWDAQGKVHIVFVAAPVPKDATLPKPDLFFHSL